MNIVSVENNWNNDTLRVDINLGNICNHKCWYCWPGSNAGTDYWPDLELLKTNITHLIGHYKSVGKTTFDFHFVGGEPTHWNKLPDLIKFLKETCNCLISMASNGSKKSSYWQKIVPYFDRVQLSCHHEFVDPESFRNIADLLYENNVIVSVSMMMDPFAWDKCMDIVEYLKGSKHNWSIRYVDLQGDTINYTPEQQKILNKHRARRANWFWFWKNNKHYISKVKVVDDEGKTHRFGDNDILLKGLNHFYGWQCNVGVDWVHIARNGEISGTCGQKIYGEDSYYNFYSETFAQDFKPIITPSICTKTSCICNIETVMKKVKVTDKKVIPIYEHKH